MHHSPRPSAERYQFECFFPDDLSRHVEALANPLLVSGVPRVLLTPTQSLLFLIPIVRF